MSDGFIPYEDLTAEQLALIFLRYLTAVSKDGFGGFRLSRKTMITEIERMSEWLTARQMEKVYESMNGGRQL